MAQCFAGCTAFEGDLSRWNTKRVVDMFRTFYQKGTIQSNIGAWDVSAVEDMGSTFEGCWIEDDLSNWDVSNVEDFGSAFEGARIEFDLSRWNPKSAKSFACMFENVFPEIDRDFSKWCVESVVNFRNMFEGTELPRHRYDALLISWSKQNVRTNCVFGAGRSRYTPGGEAEAARTKLVEEKGWTIRDGGPRVPEPPPRIPRVLENVAALSYDWFLDYQDDIIQSQEVIDTVHELIECLEIWYKTRDPKKTFAGRLHKKARSVNDLREMTKYLAENAEFEEVEWTEFVAWSSDAYDRMEKEIRDRSAMVRVRVLFRRAFSKAGLFLRTDAGSDA